MKTFTIITSIHEPGAAVKAHARIKGHRLLVVGDEKTPQAWKLEGAEFLPVSRQREMPFRIAPLLPFSHYARKMLGYLHAIGEGAECIIDSDDDITPKKGWSFPPFEGNFDCARGAEGFINVYHFFSDHAIWPRGFPLRQIRRTTAGTEVLVKQPVKVGIWQALSDVHPDVDAIYRLTSDRPCVFDERDPVVLYKKILCPFNSQNTCFQKAVFPLLYLPAHASFRFTDILRGYIAQPILWAGDLHLGFAGANTVQERNPHDFLEDFLSEIPMYRHAETLPGIVSSAVSSLDSMENNLFRAYQAIVREGILPGAELPLVEAWLSDLASMPAQ